MKLDFKKEKEARSGGTGLCTLLTVAFVVLKLCHVIDWSWWWVLAPTWIPLGIALVFVILGVIIALCTE
ncbi:MAG: hypothetical protein Q4C49_00935 [Bacillota bacterium]|nr:hypothetical protein [Bacillota bacterium]